MQKSGPMLYFAGFVTACFVIISGFGMGVSLLYRGSSLSKGAKAAGGRRPPQIRSHALISFSVILPFAALAFLLLTVSSMKMAVSQTGAERHLEFVATSMLLPTVCFLLGYFYLKKAVGS